MSLIVITRNPLCGRCRRVIDRGACGQPRAKWPFDVPFDDQTAAFVVTVFPRVDREMIQDQTNVVGNLCKRSFYDAPISRGFVEAAKPLRGSYEQHHRQKALGAYRMIASSLRGERIPIVDATFYSCEPRRKQSRASILDAGFLEREHQQTRADIVVRGTKSRLRERQRSLTLVTRL